MLADLTADLTLAIHAADAADAVSLPGFTARSFTVERKADKSEVTEVDRATETAISGLLLAQRPGYSLYGEEHGVIGAAKATLQWVIDPIDGTSNFVRDVPVWATLIALVENGVPVLGVVSAPALHRRWWAIRGGGAFCDGRRLQVSNIAQLDQASASITLNASWHHAGKTAQLESLQRSVGRLRSYGDFWQHMLVAQGAVDFAIDGIGLGPYDNAALYPIITEAGGRVTDRYGVSDYRSNSLVTSNGRLHGVVLDALESDR